MTRENSADRSECLTESLLRGMCWKNGVRFCPRCRRFRHYSLGSGLYRCATCRYTFHDFSCRWISNCNLRVRQWIHVLEAFAAEKTAKQIAAELHIAYNTAYKAVCTIRFALMGRALDAGRLFGADSLLDLTCPGRVLRQKKKEAAFPPPVFGIIDRGEWVFADIIPGFDPETILQFRLNFRLPVARHGNIVYTDRYQRYDTLVCSVGDSDVGPYIRPTKRPVHVDTLQEGFWRFARERMAKFRGLSGHRFPLYLKELEFRYNSRNTALLPRLAEALCDFVPGSDTQD